MAEASAGTTRGVVHAFWDLENCSPPRAMGTAIIQRMRTALLPFGNISSIRAYGDMTTLVKELRNDLQASGVLLRDVPYKRKKETADKILLVDLLTLLVDQPPSLPLTVALVSGDGDFAYALGKLRQRGVQVVAITPALGSNDLDFQASHVIEWEELRRVPNEVEAASEPDVNVEPLVRCLSALIETGNAQPAVATVVDDLRRLYPLTAQRLNTDTLMDGFLGAAIQGGFISVHPLEPGRGPWTWDVAPLQAAPTSTAASADLIVVPTVVTTTADNAASTSADAQSSAATSDGAATSGNPPPARTTTDLNATAAASTPSKLVVTVDDSSPFLSRRRDYYLGLGVAAQRSLANTSVSRAGDNSSGIKQRMMMAPPQLQMIPEFYLLPAICWALAESTPLFKVGAVVTHLLPDWRVRVRCRRLADWVAHAESLQLLHVTARTQLSADVAPGPTALPTHLPRLTKWLPAVSAAVAALREGRLAASTSALDDSDVAVEAPTPTTSTTSTPVVAASTTAPATTSTAANTTPTRPPASRALPVISRKSQSPPPPGATTANNTPVVIPDLSGAIPIEKPTVTTATETANTVSPSPPAPAQTATSPTTPPPAGSTVAAARSTSPSPSPSPVPSSGPVATSTPATTKKKKPKWTAEKRAARDAAKAAAEPPAEAAETVPAAPVAAVPAQPSALGVLPAKLPTPAIAFTPTPQPPASALAPIPESAPAPATPATPAPAASSPQRTPGPSYFASPTPHGTGATAPGTSDRRRRSSVVLAAAAAAGEGKERLGDAIRERLSGHTISNLSTPHTYRPFHVLDHESDKSTLSRRSPGRRRSRSPSPRRHAAGTPLKLTNAGGKLAPTAFLGGGLLSKGVHGVLGKVRAPSVVIPTSMPTEVHTYRTTERWLSPSASPATPALGRIPDYLKAPLATSTPSELRYRAGGKPYYSLNGIPDDKPAEERGPLWRFWNEGAVRSMSHTRGVGLDDEAAALNESVIL